jgi:prepilin-type N-terminal cleavage/methylation domain-containing protein
LRDERGFTLPELMVVIAILGILIAIAVAVWLGVLEQRRVDAAANQLASDLRLAHTSATNQLTDWRVVVVLGRGEEKKPDGSPNPDYYLMKLDKPYPANALNVMETIPRTFDGNVKAEQTYKDQNDSTYPTGYASPETPTPSSTLTFEFNSNGSAWTYPAVSGSACVTVDDDPELRIYARSATAQVEVRDATC